MAVSLRSTRARCLMVCWLLATIPAGIVCADIRVGSHTWQHRLWNHDYPDNRSEYGGGYGHLDISWTWTMESGIERAERDWTTVADCLDENPSYFGGHGGMQSVQYLLRKYEPATFARIKAHSDAGRYEGSEMSWSEGYYAFGGDEYYLRNYYISTRFCKDVFGYLPLIAAGYDLDAPCWTQPKIQTYVSGRSPDNPTGVGFFNHCSWMEGSWPTHDGQTGMRPDILRPNGWEQFNWTSDDGSTVIAGSGGIYAGDGGGAEICVPARGRFQDFARKVLEEKAWDNPDRNVWNSYLISSGIGYSLLFWGAKMGENRLLEAEKFATFARPYGYVYPLHGEDYLYEVWGGQIMLNQHDVADACGTPSETMYSNGTNINLQDYIHLALDVARTTTANALAAISSNVNTSGEGTSVIVYNAMSWSRTDRVMLSTSDLGFSSPVSVRAPDGTVVPSQVIDDGGVGKLIFTAENVPSLGYKEYKVFNTAPPGGTGVTAVDGAEITLENEFCTVKVDKSSGAITGIYDKVSSRQLLSGPGNRIASTTDTPRWMEGCCNSWTPHHPKTMPANLTYKAPSSVRLLDTGPAVARIRATYNENGVDWDHDIMLFRKVPVVCNRMVTSNLTRANELSVDLPLAASVSNSAREFDAGVAYGHHRYVNNNYMPWKCWEDGCAPDAHYPSAMYTPTHKWANVTNDARDYGVALLENNCTVRAFYDAGGNRDLRLVLIAANMGDHEPNWEMSWGVWGHTGDWTDGAVQKGYEFNSPLVPRVELSHTGTLPKEHSFITVEPENVVVTVVKKWEDESPTQQGYTTMQMRFYEIDGKDTEAVFRFPASRQVSAWESHGNEYGVYGGQLPVSMEDGKQKLTFSMGHNQIRSLKVQMPYAATGDVIGGADRFVHHRSRGAAQARVFDLKGRTLWQGTDFAALRSALPRLMAPGGIYLVQHRSTDGELMETRKLCGSGKAQ